MSAVSLDDAWGTSDHKPVHQPTQDDPIVEARVPLNDVPNQPTAKRFDHKDRERERERIMHVVAHELRKQRLESADRHRQCIIVLTLSLGLLTVFLALSWHSHQKMIHHLSFLLWSLDHRMPHRP